MSCDNSKFTTDLNNDRIDSKIIVTDNDMECENVGFVQHENANIFVQNANRQSESDLERSSLNVSGDESSDLSFKNENESKSDFEDDPAIWSVEHKITHTALKALLLTLKKHSCFSTLSLDARTILKIPRQQDIRTVVPGSYHHFGLIESIKQILSSVKENIDCLKIAVNIDGLPLTKSSQQQFWPILGSVMPYGNVFMIGLYHGYEKPKDTNDFLKFCQ